MLKVDDWIANGFTDDEGWLLDEGVCRLHATGKGAIIDRLVEMHGFDVTKVVSIGDSEMDLSCRLKKSVIGFNPTEKPKLPFGSRRSRS